MDTQIKQAFDPSAIGATAAKLLGGALGFHVGANALLSARNAIPGVRGIMSNAAMRGVEHGLTGRTLRSGLLSPLMHLGGPEWLVTYGFGNRLGKSLAALPPAQRERVVRKFIHDLTYTKHLKTAPVLGDVLGGLKKIPKGGLENPELIDRAGILSRLGMPTFSRATKKLFSRARTAAQDDVSKAYKLNEAWVPGRGAVERAMSPDMAGMAPSDVATWRQGSLWTYPILGAELSGVLHTPFGVHALVNRLLRVKEFMGSGTSGPLREQIARGLSGEKVPFYTPITRGATAHAGSRVGQMTLTGLGPAFHDVAYRFNREIQRDPQQATKVYRDIVEALTAKPDSPKTLAARAAILLNPQGFPGLAKTYLNDPKAFEGLQASAKSLAEAAEPAKELVSRAIQRRLGFHPGAGVPKVREVIRKFLGPEYERLLPKDPVAQVLEQRAKTIR